MIMIASVSIISALFWPGKFYVICLIASWAVILKMFDGFLNAVNASKAAVASGDFDQTSYLKSLRVFMLAMLAAVIVTVSAPVWLLVNGWRMTGIVTAVFVAGFTVFVAVMLVKVFKQYKWHKLFNEDPDEAVRQVDND